MLRELAPDQLWIADMAVQRSGFAIGARMTVIRLPNGELFLHSPIALRPDLKSAVDALGPVRFLIAPSRFHYLHVAEFARTYPDARVYAVPGLRKKLPGVEIHERLGDTPVPAWAGVLDQSPIRGSALYDEIDFCHRPSRTLILTDRLFNIPGNRSLMTRLVAGAFGFLDRVAPSRSFSLFARDRTAIRASLERILAWDFDRIIFSHGNIVETGGKEAFRKAFTRFLE